MKLDLIDGIPEVYVEAWGVAKTLERLGFSPGEISCRIEPWVRDRKRQAISVVLNSQGKEFSCIVGQIGAPAEDAVATFQAVRDRMVRAGDFRAYEVWVLKTLYGKNRNHFHTLAQQLGNAGFVVPGLAKP